MTVGMLGISAVRVGAEALSKDGDILYRSWLDRDRFVWSVSDPDIVTLTDTTCLPTGRRCRLITSVSEGEGTITATTQGLTDSISITVRDRARVAWSVPIGLGRSFSDVAVAIDGTIYVGTDEPALARSRWSALSPQGGVVWTVDLPLTFKSSPAIGEDGTLYLGSRSAGADGSVGRLIAVNPGGSVRWMLEGIDGIRSSPSIGPDGTVYVAGERHIYAVDPQGEIRWVYEAASDVFAFSSPAVAGDGTIYVGAEDYHLYAINPDGSLQWRFQTDDRIRSSPSIGPDGAIYVGSHDGRLYSVNPDGTERWNIPIHCGLDWGCEPIQSTPSIGVDGTIYVGADAIYAIDPAGSIRWSLLGGGVVWTPVVGANGTIYFTDLSTPVGGKLYAADAQGRILWEYPTGGRVSASPAIGVDGSIIAVSFGGSSGSGDEGRAHAIIETVSTNGGYAGSPWPTARGDRGNTGRAGR
ncbi:MAG: PQQ-binding-like beta-propeller repeat protein [Gemmatimonadota bacterium]|nr:PQQ-binding-like beta-propeller repeat protein [Gemmatimonadota bacterium]